MRTIGTHWNGEPGDYPCFCDYCGVKWRRSQLRRDGSGKLYCPDEGDGRDAVTLSKLNAAAALAGRRIPSGPKDGKSRSEYDP